MVSTVSLSCLCTGAKTIVRKFMITVMLLRFYVNAIAVVRWTLRCTKVNSVANIFCLCLMYLQHDVECRV